MRSTWHRRTGTSPRPRRTQRLRQDGHETDLAEALLDILEGTLAAFKHHREIVLKQRDMPP